MVKMSDLNLFVSVCQNKIAAVVFDAVKPPLATANLATRTADASRAFSIIIEAHHSGRQASM